MNLRQAKKLLGILGVPHDVLFNSLTTSNVILLKYPYISDKNLLKEVKELVPNAMFDNVIDESGTEPSATLIVIENVTFPALSFISKKTTGRPFSFLFYFTDEVLRKLSQIQNKIKM